MKQTIRSKLGGIPSKGQSRANLQELIMFRTEDLTTILIAWKAGVSSNTDPAGLAGLGSPIVKVSGQTGYQCNLRYQHIPCSKLVLHSIKHLEIPLRNIT